MKVYDYLTLATTFEEEYTEFKSYLFNKFGIYFIKEDFYNLPFTPELITKFFKGWDLNCDNKKNYYEIHNYHKNILVTLHSGKIAYFKRQNWYDIPVPIVLNDFIRDCKRCKIELEM